MAPKPSMTPQTSQESSLPVKGVFTLECFSSSKNLVFPLIIIVYAITHVDAQTLPEWSDHAANPPLQYDKGDKKQ